MNWMMTLGGAELLADCNYGYKPEVITASVLYLAVQSDCMRNCIIAFTNFVFSACIIGNGPGDEATYHRTGFNCIVRCCIFMLTASGMGYAGLSNSTNTCNL